MWSFKGTDHVNHTEWDMAGISHGHTTYPTSYIPTEIQHLLYKKITITMWDVTQVVDTGARTSISERGGVGVVHPAVTHMLSG